MLTVMQIDIFLYIECCINLVDGEICSGIVSHYTLNWFIQYLNYIFWQPAFTKPFFLSRFVDKMKMCFGSFSLGNYVIR